MTEGSYSKRDLEILRKIVKYCDDIEYFIQLYGSDESGFHDNLSLQYGCVFSLSQIGEYVKKLSSEFTEDHRETDWRGIAGLRNLIVHNYEGVDVLRVRSTILNKVPALKEDCLRMLGRI